MNNNSYCVLREENQNSGVEIRYIVPKAQEDTARRASTLNASLDEIRFTRYEIRDTNLVLRFLFFVLLLTTIHYILNTNLKYYFKKIGVLKNVQKEKSSKENKNTRSCVPR